jgi:hypothetical protein
VGKQAPSASSPHHVEHGVQELAGLGGSWYTSGRWSGHERSEYLPLLLVGEVGRVGTAGLHRGSSEVETLAARRAM